MKCPFCTELENKVIDSRLSKDGLSIRRRRECLACQRRFTTYERVEEIQPLVIKSDSRREAFDRGKIRSGMVKATQKRPISIEIIDEFVDSLERRFQETNQKEIPSSEIGEQVMAKLYELDKVAYVRFASVYKPFKDLDDFVSELRELLDSPNERNSGRILNGLKGTREK
jgi:transcriptional repressor NrdR